MNKSHEKMRRSMITLSFFCTISLILLGILSREMDWGYILIGGFSTIAWIIEPFVIQAWKNHKARIAYQQKMAQEAERRKKIEEKQKQIREQKRLQEEAEEERERLEAVRIAQENLRKKSSGKIRTSWNKNPSA